MLLHSQIMIKDWEAGIIKSTYIYFTERIIHKETVYLQKEKMHQGQKWPFSHLREKINDVVKLLGKWDTEAPCFPLFLENVRLFSGTYETETWMNLKFHSLLGPSLLGKDSNWGF